MVLQAWAACPLRRLLGLGGAFRASSLSSSGGRTTAGKDTWSSLVTSQTGGLRRGTRDRGGAHPSLRSTRCAAAAPASSQDTGTLGAAVRVRVRLPKRECQGSGQRDVRHLVQGHRTSVAGWANLGGATLGVERLPCSSHGQWTRGCRLPFWAWKEKPRCAVRPTCRRRHVRPVWGRRSQCHRCTHGSRAQQEPGGEQV